MLEGLWSVEIMSPSGGVSAGVIVFQPRRVFGDFFEDGRILGGDRNYFYSGTYTIENYGVTGDFEVVHYADETHPMFGPDKNFRMKISGQLDRHVNRDVLQFAGHRVDAPDRQLSLRLIRRVEPS